MSNTVRFQWNGMVEAKRAFQELPETLRAEGGRIVLTGAERAKAAMVAQYPAGKSGKLKSGVTITRSDGGSGRFGVAYYVRNRARYNRKYDAYVYEIGVGNPRRTASGANRGITQPGNVFIPVMQQTRRQVNAALADLLRRHGMTVTGDSG